MSRVTDAELELLVAAILQSEMAMSELQLVWEHFCHTATELWVINPPTQRAQLERRLMEDMMRRWGFMEWSDGNVKAFDNACLQSYGESEA